MKKDFQKPSTLNAFLNKINHKFPKVTITLFEQPRNPRDPVAEPNRLMVKFTGGKLGQRVIPVAGYYQQEEDGSGEHWVNLDDPEKSRYKAHLQDYAERGGLV